MRFKNMIAATAVLCLTAAGSANQQTERLLDKVRQNYQSLKAVCADFTQTYHWQLTGEVQIVKGNICAFDGSQFKIETSDQLIVTNGKVLWTLNKASNQVIIDRPENASSENPFIKDFLDKYLTGYAAKPSASTLPGAVCVVMTSETGEHFVTQIKLWIDEKSNLIRRIEQVDLNDNVTLLELENINTAATLAPRDFILTVPKDADVIDMR